MKAIKLHFDNLFLKHLLIALLFMPLLFAYVFAAYAGDSSPFNVIARFDATEWTFVLCFSLALPTAFALINSTVISFLRANQH